MDLTDLTFIDIETTGLSPIRDRIIEIGVLRMKNGRITKRYETLVNPDCNLPPEITMLTGITAKQLENAPVFSRIADDLEELLHDSIFVAHNARFDYSFIRSEFARLEKTFRSQTLCTAKLSRRLFPRFHRHSLDSIIDRFGIACDLRHRAFSDAKVLADFYKLATKQFGRDVLTDAIMHVTKTTALPKAVSRETVNALPESPGVYVFYGQDGQPLYIGKSIDIKQRVLSHFYDFSESTKEARIFHTIASIETHRTSGELGALLLESQMIKDMQPLYNRKLRKQQTMVAVIKDQTANGYDTIRIWEGAEVNISDIENILAVFRTKGQMKRTLIDLARDFTLCQKLLGLEKTGGACFGAQIETCHGACTGNELPARYNMRFTQAFSKTRIKQWPFRGAIAIREGNNTFIVDRWCYMGDKNGTTEPVFDYDTYKILSSHLLKKTRDSSIHVLDTHEAHEPSDWHATP